jgi:heptaprenyl diphosphate synthase
MALILVPAFVLQRSTSFKALQVLVFACLCLFAGRRILPLRAAFVLLFVTIFHLLSPAGRVLLKAGPLAVTSIALETGLYRGLTALGLFYISKFCVREDLRLPGSIGRIFGRVFYYYSLLLQMAELHPRRLVKSLDELLIRAYQMDQPVGDESDVHTTWRGAALMSGIVILSVSLSLWSLSGPEMVVP